METSVLERLGMSKGEIGVYLALSKLGESTVTPIVYESKVSKSKIYDILERLIDKGLVGYVAKNNVKHFVANDPHMILDYVEGKEEELLDTKKRVVELLPQLLLSRKETQSKRLAEVYEGFLGLRAIREELMQSFKKGETLFRSWRPKSS